MDVLTFYVGQGAMSLVRHGGEAVFVDSLIPSSDDGIQERIAKMLERLLRNHVVAGLILTGLDADHCCPKGIELILSQYQPRWVMYPKYYKDTDTAEEAFRIISKHYVRRRRSANPLRRVSVRVERVDSRQLTGLSQQFEFELFSPHFEDMDSSNNSSIVLRLRGCGRAGFSYLITGDTENDRWERINTIFGDALRSDVLAAPHHGSKNGAHPRTILLVSPHTVLISAGIDNAYDHPDPQAVKAYREVAKHVYATNVNGGVSLFTKADGPDFYTRLVH